jgi:hypothetical protein
VIGGALYLLLFAGCFALTAFTALLAWILYRVGKGREARAAALRAARRGDGSVAAEAPLVSVIPLGGSVPDAAHPPEAQPQEEGR